MTFPAERFAIGIDIGATKIASVIMSEQGDLVASLQTLTLADEGTEAVLDRIAGQILDLANQSPGPVAGVGIGSPGQVDSDCGIVYDAVNLGWKEVPLVEAISHRLGNNLPIWIQKDANLNALGEYYFGAGQGYDDFVYLGVGSGLGAGILSNGQLITGAGWYAADVGHLSLDPDGPACLCGGRGCAELVASGPGLVRVAQHMLASPSTKSALGNFPALT
ncbi:MAG: ROK family protein, partial [Chloroflexota bacterium]|nr:ROK family protein [Chloroflexota bacterium]